MAGTAASEPTYVFRFNQKQFALKWQIKSAVSKDRKQLTKEYKISKRDSKKASELIRRLVPKIS